MDKKQFAAWAMALKTYYPREDIIPNDKAIELWFKQLCDLDYNVAELALNIWVSQNKWAPTIADIRQQAAQAVKGEVPDWGEGWNQVQRAIRFYGMYREAEAMASMDITTADIVRRLGYQNLCTSDNEIADRANFRDLYEKITQRTVMQDVLPVTIREKMQAIRIEAAAAGSSRLVGVNNDG